MLGHSNVHDSNFSSLGQLGPTLSLERGLDLNDLINPDCPGKTYLS